MYSLPAGHMDGNESVAEATAREAKEEIGITLNPKDLKVIQVIHRFSPSNKIPREYIDFFLTATIWQGEIKNCEPEKCDEVCWYLLNKLPKNILPYVKNTLKNFERGVFFSEEVF